MNATGSATTLISGDAGSRSNLLQSSLQLVLTSHRDGGVNGVFEIDRVAGRALVPIAEVHAIVARARLAWSEPKMQSLSNCQLSLAVEPACQLVALDLREWHHTCLASRISMASTRGSLRQRLALRSASAQLPTHSAWLQAATPLGQNLLGGCAAKWITTQCE